jgi:hypothetical protein
MDSALNQAQRDLIRLDPDERYRITQALVEMLELEIKTHQQAIAELKRVKAPTSEPEDLPDPATERTPSQFDAALKKWLAFVEDRKNRGASEVTIVKLGVDRGGAKFFRVWSEMPGNKYSKSAVAFIDKATGDVYKPDGWKKPARGVRGNIFTPTNYGVGPTGFVHYLK